MGGSSSGFVFFTVCGYERVVMQYVPILAKTMESRGSCCTKQHFINDGSMKIVHRLYFKRLYYKYVLFPTKLTCVECISVFCSAVLSCMTTVFPPNSGHLIVSNSQALLLKPFNSVLTLICNFHKTLYSQLNLRF